MQRFPEKYDLWEIPGSGICQIIKKLISYHRKIFAWNKTFWMNTEKLQEGSKCFLWGGKKDSKELTLNIKILKLRRFYIHVYKSI